MVFDSCNQVPRKPDPMPEGLDDFGPLLLTGPSTGTSRDQPRNPTVSTCSETSMPIMSILYLCKSKGAHMVETALS